MCGVKMSGLLFLDHRPYFIDQSLNKSKANCGCTIALVSFDSGINDGNRPSGLGNFVLNFN